MKKEYKVKLGGKIRVFTYGLVFIGEVLERLDVSYEEMFNKVGKNIVKYAPIMMFESLKNTYNIKDKEVDFTEKDIISWLEKEDFSGYTVINDFINSFIESMTNKTTLEKTSNESKDVKKK